MLESPSRIIRAVAEASCHRERAIQASPLRMTREAHSYVPELYWAEACSTGTFVIRYYAALPVSRRIAARVSGMMSGTVAKVQMAESRHHEQNAFCFVA